MDLERKQGSNTKAEKIANGYKNLLKSKLGLSSLLDKAIFDSRKNICEACAFKSALNRCLKCGCPLAAKQKSLIDQCPIGLW